MKSISKSNISEVLQPLVGLPIRSWLSCLDLTGFYFGREFPHVNLRGESVMREEYSLHIQCSWRVISEKESPCVIVGSADKEFPGDASMSVSDFDSDKDVSLLETRMKHWMECCLNQKATVLKVAVDAVGGFNLFFSNDTVLQVFPNLSVTAHSEWYRLMHHEGKHCVVGGFGMECD